MKPDLAELVARGASAPSPPVPGAVLLWGFVQDFNVPHLQAEELSPAQSGISLLLCLSCLGCSVGMVFLISKRLLSSAL